MEQHWGEIPETPSNLYHDILANSVFKMINPSDKLNVSVERPEANPYIGSSEELRNNQPETSKISQTSPFYETLKLMLNYNEDVCSNGVANGGENGEQSERRQVSNSLRDTVILILTYTGFDSASELAVDALADVLEYYLQSFCQMMRTFTDSTDMQSPNDFSDTVCKVLHHMNVPDYDSLRKFNQELNSYYNLMKMKQQSK